MTLADDATPAVLHGLACAGAAGQDMNIAIVHALVHHPNGFSDKSLDTGTKSIVSDFEPLVVTPSPVRFCDNVREADLTL